MRRKHMILVVAFLVLIFFLITRNLCIAKTSIKVVIPQTDRHQGVTIWNFEDVAVGKLPTGWKVEATGRGKPLATWQVVEDSTAPSGGKVLALVRVNHHSGGTFNLFWTSGVPFLNGSLKVAFKANTGKIDEGGGIMWRVQDRNNYYVARFNPLEDNFRIYYVKNGGRRMIGTARASLPAGTWHTMKIVVKGNHYACFLDGKKYLDGKDSHFKMTGGVGLWTKADAATSFDDFTVVTGKSR